MKMKYVLMAFASMFMVACSDENEVVPSSVEMVHIKSSSIWVLLPEMPRLQELVVIFPRVVLAIHITITRYLSTLWKTGMEMR